MDHLRARRLERRASSPRSFVVRKLAAVAASAMDIPKSLVADSAELLLWAQSKVGEMLGETTKGKRHDREPSPSGESIDRMARHRYRDMARIGEGNLQAYVAEARTKYLADDARTGPACTAIRRLRHAPGRES
jgi:hypothetical protein